LIRLFTTSYPEASPARKLEIDECLTRNIACEAIDEIRILAEGPSSGIPSSSKVKVRAIAARPTYDDYFEWIRQTASDADVSIVANADIYFDQSIRILARRPPEDSAVFALSRWNAGADGVAELYDHNDSQDAWIFRGVPRPIQGDFPVGVPRCDNRLVHELAMAGYRVLNPSFSLRAFHLHAGERRPYGETLPGYVDPPYGYVWPHNLRSLPATLLYNLRHPQEPVGWRIDSRWLAKRLKLHAFSKIHRAFRSFVSQLVRGES
jgi:hypothetical protein